MIDQAAGCLATAREAGRGQATAVIGRGSEAGASITHPSYHPKYSL